MLLKRTQIRHALIAVLSDPHTAVMPTGDLGLTLAEDRILDTYLDPNSLDCQGKLKLPLIAVYSEDEELRGTDDNNYDQLCFNKSELLIHLELFVCASEGHELEAVLDQLELQVRCKVLADKRLRHLARLRGYRTNTRRSGDGSRLGQRLIQLRFEYADAVRIALGYEPMKTAINWQSDDYVREPAVIHSMGD